ncbi:hypothetical protein EHO59_11565 [Leptospira semungkisensis]|uniref:Lipoprotein n=1 Tax=Leptospira semungkisensis TaxID=2484985 RepID=A0A4R9FQL5_9LEPT|nr:hypothetical protein [Leptospira semungkisensis]TGK01092.1 hypothetical protein EHO59_11565 [Leptospira semungkisensis]
MTNHLSLFRIITSFVFVSILFANCATTEIEEIPFRQKGKIKFWSAKSKDGQKYLDGLRKLEETNTSYSGEFDIRIQNFFPKKDVFSLSGKIMYDKPTGKMQIELTDKLFGISVSKVFTDGNTIRIKTASVDKVHEQPMDDIVLSDPNTGKQTIVPFPVIYYLLSNRNAQLFKPEWTIVQPTEGIVLVRKPGEEWTYYTKEKGIYSVEWDSSGKNVKAVTNVQGELEFPPKVTVTRIVSRTDGSDQNRIEIKMKKVNRTDSLNQVVFGF